MSLKRGEGRSLSLTLRRASAQSASTSGYSRHQKKFPNGDTYTGGWRNGLPEGEGRYCWADASTYKGGWKNGSKHGLGTYTWPNGASYKGEWQNGCMHGVGSFKSPDGTCYEGGWAQDLKQGLGKKVYANGDIYEGLWKAGKCEGPGRYRWKNRNEYDGEWKAGRMHGKGTLKWNTGDRYDGEFKNGQEDGIGIFTWADGSTYNGFWREGCKEGVGVYRPAPTENKRATTPLERHTTQPADLPRWRRRAPRWRRWREKGMPHHRGAATRRMHQVSPCCGRLGLTGMHLVQPIEVPGRAAGRGDRAERVFVREYEAGRLVREDPIAPEELEAVFGPFRRRADRAERRQRRRRRVANKLGETIYKGHRSYDLMLNLQLGIRHSSQQVAKEPPLKQLSEEHFQQKLKQFFPRDGSKATPPHPSTDFRWKDYCPMAFRQLREVFNIEAAEYMKSICGDQALRELASPGKSGSVFFVSHDDKYMIKTMRKGEVKLLLELLPKYAAHVEKHPHTLLVKFFGLYRVTPENGSKVRFIVMNNVFQNALPIAKQYDLKGSTQGRTSATDAPRPATILKDLDLDIKVKLEEGWHDRLMDQLAADCALLEELRVMDYSLLLGVHYRSTGWASSPPATDKEDEGDDDGDTPHAPMNGGVLAVLPQRSAQSTTDGPESPQQASPLRAAGATDEISHSMGQQRTQLGMNVVGTALPADADSNATPEDVVLYFGIIDILQEYNMTKRLEHGYKSIFNNGRTISAVDPKHYSRRFQDFLKKVFV
ncbi:PIP5K-domain-containing protein [Coccomyxa subellipsoidea C-169]|uniref:1-phosphatidylinositol-4-phosphate 5-kinase n=1 Tax=Coccomyxa subellipsoidea (strain C-169) TaxID=574566 RepID=I0YIG3_COCSC|nr:PIP5K-domain-containing protein [Coccomyxa subellipsoidea C-169]EIE18182.1 PIP5K-domain-containing protein [Coccomyxa subellipsoidea C-169]|eukprot:XP_005642726.1 PIP5K-domain-containing protein [Coccomyxa subellipsoidea C-169]